MGFRHDVLRTYLNGWTTADRRHSEPLPCIFCKEPGSDAMKHNACQCGHLADVMDASVSTPPGPFSCLLRFGVCPLEPSRAATASILYRIVAKIQGTLPPDALIEQARAVARSRFA